MSQNESDSSSLDERPNGNAEWQEILESKLTLNAALLRHEAELIRKALEVSRGSVSRAAKLLGLTHQGLAFIINGRQKALLPNRRPVRQRRKSLISKAKSKELALARKEKKVKKKMDDTWKCVALFFYL